MPNIVNFYNENYAGIYTINILKIKTDIAMKYFREFHRKYGYAQYDSYSITEKEKLINDFMYDLDCFISDIDAVDSFENLINAYYPHISDTESEVKVCEVSEEK